MKVLLLYFLRLKSCSFQDHEERFIEEGKRDEMKETGDTYEATCKGSMVVCVWERSWSHVPKKRYCFKF